MASLVLQLRAETQEGGMGPDEIIRNDLGRTLLFRQIIFGNSLQRFWIFLHLHDYSFQLWIR
jgi:hypothetical protein